MKAFSLAAFLLASPCAYAAPHQLRVDIQLLINGKAVSAPRIVVLDGQEAEIADIGQSSNMKMRVVATEQKNKDAILMKFRIEYSSSARTIKTSPMILAKSGQEAMISLGGNSADEVQLKVTAVSAP